MKKPIARLADSQIAQVLIALLFYLL